MGSKGRAIAAAFGMLTASAALSADYADCILEKMPGTQNFAVHQAVIRACLADHPEGFLASKQGSGRGFFGFDGRDSCVRKKAANTPFGAAAASISAACYCLYEKPSFHGEMCAYRQ